MFDGKGDAEGHLVAGDPVVLDLGGEVLDLQAGDAPEGSSRPWARPCWTASSKLLSDSGTSSITFATDMGCSFRPSRPHRCCRPGRCRDAESARLAGHGGAMISSAVVSKDGKNLAPRIANRRAMHDYFIEAKIECGIALVGSEVKSLRKAQSNDPQPHAQCPRRGGTLGFHRRMDVTLLVQPFPLPAIQFRHSVRD